MMKKLLLFLLLTAAVIGQETTSPSFLEKDYKLNVRLATDVALAAVTATATTLTANAAGALSVDSVAVALNDRILVQDQVLTQNNGIYFVSRLGTGGVAFILTRTTDSNSWAELPGAVVVATVGTVNAAKLFVNTSAATGTLGTTGITYSEISGGAAAGTDPVVETITVNTATTPDELTPAAEGNDGGIVTTGLAAATKIMNPTGTPADGQKYWLRVKSTATSYTLTWDTLYRFSTDMPQPTANSGSSLTDYLVFQYNLADTKWDCVGKNFGF